MDLVGKASIVPDVLDGLHPVEESAVISGTMPISSILQRDLTAMICERGKLASDKQQMAHLILDELAARQCKL